MSQVEDVRKLAMVEGLGWKRFQLLREYFGNAKRVWEAEPSEWEKVGVPKKVVESFGSLKVPNQPQVEDKNNKQQLSSTKNGNADSLRFGTMTRLVVHEEENYPERLREIGSPPLGLFYEGDVDLLKIEKIIAVVGTRRMTREGERLTRQFVKGLVKNGWVIVSGLARGVDRVAHEECLRWGGKTIAVLGHGLNMTYPKEHEDLRKKIVESGGLIVSEYAPWIKPKPNYFVARNRIVAGLSQAVLVTEAYVKSGTKITVGFALEQGKDVYVIPGSPEKPSFRGNIEMIQQGAWPVLEIGEIISRVGPL